MAEIAQYKLSKTLAMQFKLYSTGTGIVQKKNT